MHRRHRALRGHLAHSRRPLGRGERVGGPLPGRRRPAGGGAGGADSRRLPGRGRLVPAGRRPSRLGDPFLGDPHDRLGGRLPGGLLLAVRARGQRQHHPGGAQRHLGGIHPLDEHPVPGVDGLLDPLLHRTVDAPRVPVVGQDAQMGQQAREVVGAPPGAHGVDVEQAHHPAVLHEHLSLVEVAVDHVMRSHVHALLERGQPVADRPHQGIQPRPERGDRGADDPGVEVHRVRPRRAQRQGVHRGGQTIQQRHQILGAAGVHALVDHSARERPPGQLGEHHQPVVMGDHLGHRHPGREQPVMAVHDLTAAVGLHDLEEHGPIAL